MCKNKKDILKIKCAICEHEEIYESLEGVKILFCKQCGRPLWTNNEEILD